MYKYEVRIYLWAVLSTVQKLKQIKYKSFRWKRDKAIVQSPSSSIFRGNEYFMQIQINVCMQYERFIKYKTIMEFKGLRRKKK